MPSYTQKMMFMNRGEERARLLGLFPEFLDVFDVLIFGMSKYGGNGDNWLEPNSKKMDHKSNHDSMFHHLSESLVLQNIQGIENRNDHESKLDVLLHLACRALMAYTRGQRGIRHDDD